MLLKKNNGFTLIELTLYLGLLSIFLVFFSELLSAILNTKTRSEGVSLVQTNSNFLISKLTYDVNQADTIASPIDFGVASDSFGLNKAGQGYTYRINGGRLAIDDGQGLVYLSDANVTINNFNVTKTGNTDGIQALSIGFTISSNIVDKTGIKESSFLTTISLR